MENKAAASDWSEANKKEVSTGVKITPVSDSNSIMAIISRAATDPVFDVAKLDHLLAVKERWEKEEARKAFVSALNAFKADPPELFKNKLVNFKTDRGQTSYKHATLDQVSIAIGSKLAEHNLSHRWNVEQRDGQIKVTCVLTHSAGHSESVSLVSGADTSGSKNSIQAIGSAITYLQRYSLLATTGMAVQEDDNDGRKIDGHAADAAKAAFRQAAPASAVVAEARKEQAPAAADGPKKVDCCNRKSATEDHKAGCPHAPKPAVVMAHAAAKKRPF